MARKDEVNLSATERVTRVDHLLELCNLRDEVAESTGAVAVMGSNNSRKPQLCRTVRLQEAQLWQWQCLVFVGLLMVLSAAASICWQPLQESLGASHLNKPFVTRTPIATEAPASAV